MSGKLEGHGVMATEGISEIDSLKLKQGSEVQVYRCTEKTDAVTRRGERHMTEDCRGGGQSMGRDRMGSHVLIPSAKCPARQMADNVIDKDGRAKEELTLKGKFNLISSEIVSQQVLFPTPLLKRKDK